MPKQVRLDALGTMHHVIVRGSYRQRIALMVSRIEEGSLADREGKKVARPVIDTPASPLG